MALGLPPFNTGSLLASLTLTNLVTERGGKMLKLDDIFALAKQGYKPSDIKELIELSKEAEVKTEEVPDQEEKENTSTPSHTVAPEEGKPSESAEASEVVDYKKKAEELEKKLSDLQRANTQKNIADTDEKSDSEVIADLMKSFM